MRVPGQKFFRRITKPLSKRLNPGAMILGYHRIADPEWDPLGIAVGVENFTEQLEILRRHKEIVELKELLNRRNAGRSIDDLAVLTFDDGYLDFKRTVLPLLSQAQAPATVFVPSGFVGGRFWWDQVSALMRPVGRERGELLLSFPGFFDKKLYSGVDNRLGAVRAIRDICHRLRGGNSAAVAYVLEALEGWSVKFVDDEETTGRPMDAPELIAIDASELVDIGGHGRNHGCLGELKTEEQKFEIEGCLDDLREILGREVTVFSYPNGSYARTTPDLVKEAGLRAACSSLERTFTRRNSPYAIPRVWAPDAGGEEFERWMSAWTLMRKPLQ